MSPTSPQMARALVDLREWSTIWQRHRDGRQVYWKSARYASEPPTISDATMSTLMRRGEIRAVCRNDRGVCDMAELAP